MAEPKRTEQKRKAEDTVKRRRRKPLERRRFEWLLRMAVNTSPLRKTKRPNHGDENEHDGIALGLSKKNSTFNGNAGDHCGDTTEN